MSNFRIIGTENPIVGEKTTYAVSEILPGSHTVGNNSSFKEPIHWSIYQLKRGEWVHKPKNDNLGNTVDYTFIERTIRYEGLRIIAKRGDEIARMNLKTQRAEVGKILKVDLLDYYGNKPTQAFAYGQRVMARVHCVNLDLCVGSVTLWEDDELARTGQNLANKKNTAITLPFEVIDGKAEVIFLLNQSFDKMANARTDAKRDIKTKDEGQLHEYYVTAQILNQATESSNSVAVHNLEAPIAPHKEKITIQQTASAKTPPTIKKGVSRVFLTDTTNQPIKGVFKEKLIKVWIISTGLIGRDICLKLYDEDNLSNDLLLNQNFKIKADTHDVVVSLNTIPRSKGGNYIGEGSEQELFVDIEVLQTQEHTKSAVINVDASVFKQDPMPIIDSLLTIFEDEEREEKKEDEKCPRCNEDFKYDDIVNVFPSASKNKTLATELIVEINLLRIKYQINTCLRKAHLINQFGSETDFNTLIEKIDGYSVSTLINLFGYFNRHPNEAAVFKGNLYEISTRAYGLRKVDKEEDIISCDVKPGVKCNDLGNESKKDGYTYIGRGLIQLTGKYNYSQVNKDFVKAFPNQGDLIKNPELLEKPQYAAMSAFSYWINNNLNSIADLGFAPSNVDAITKIINKNLDDSHYEKRRKSFVKAKEVYRLNECKNTVNNKSDTTNATIRLIRKWQTSKSTIGEFTIDNSDIKGYILEEKGPDTTVSGIEQRVPIGTYNLIWHNGTKFKNVLKLYNDSVSINRAILIHSGNSAESTEGCLLPGSSKSLDWVSNSRDKLEEINNYVKSVGIENVKIIITQEYE